MDVVVGQLEVTKLIVDLKKLKNLEGLAKETKNIFEGIHQIYCPKSK